MVAAAVASSSSLVLVVIVVNERRVLAESAGQLGHDLLGVGDADGAFALLGDALEERLEQIVQMRVQLVQRFAFGRRRLRRVYLQGVDGMSISAD